MRRGSAFGFARALMREASSEGRMTWSVLVDAFRGARIAPEASRAELNALRNGVNFRGVRPDYILLDRLPELQPPLLIVWGAQDKVLPVAHAYAAAERHPAAQMVVLDRCGHWPQLEQAEAFNRVLEAYLAEDDPKGPPA